MKQFNLEEYLANPERKVVTRDGRPIRIICTDFKQNAHDIIALVTNKRMNGETYESIYQYFKDGTDEGYPNENTLFFAPVKKSRWVFLYRTLGGEICASCAYTSRKAAEYGMKKRMKPLTLNEMTWEE